MPTSELTPGSTSAPTSEPTPRSTPAPTSAPESSEAPVYVVHDPGGSGIIVDLSLQSVGMLPEHPAWHAAELLDRLMHDAEFAGKLASEKALKKFYAVICHDDGIRPLPWTIVLRHFNAGLREIHGPAYKKAYKRLYEGGRLRMRRVYCIPPAQSATQSPEQAEVVANDAKSVPANSLGLAARSGHRTGTNSHLGGVARGRRLLPEHEQRRGVNLPS